jgi:hypothetical protein
MARVLHLLKGDHAAEAMTVITPEAATGDAVAVALMSGATAPAVPAGVTLHRVPEDTSYDRLLEMIFEADRVVAW